MKSIHILGVNDIHCGNVLIPWFNVLRNDRICDRKRCWWEEEWKQGRTQLAQRDLKLERAST